MNQKNQNEHKFYYNSTPDVICVFICSAFSIIFYYVAIKHYSSMIDCAEIEKVFNYVIRFILFLINATILLFILANFKQCLTIKNGIVIYTAGILIKRQITMPVNRICCCELNVGIIQRMFNSSTLTIESNGSKIFFSNIYNGEEAHKLILQLTGLTS